jgi:pSer/pThr/pTyr-binding forkhead associated (FHA) protein
MKFGRAHETEIRINDISVSRNQATIKMIDNEVYI